MRQQNKIVSQYYDQLDRGLVSEMRDLALGAMVRGGAVPEPVRLMLFCVSLLTEGLEWCVRVQLRWSEW